MKASHIYIYICPHTHTHIYAQLEDNSKWQELIILGTTFDRVWRVAFLMALSQSILARFHSLNVVAFMLPVPKVAETFIPIDSYYVNPSVRVKLSCSSGLKANPLSFYPLKYAKSP